MKSLSIGILAHVDAGKTSLTERILFDAGVIKILGSVDEGTTQTDSMELERERGITITSAVVSFCIHNLKINLIDTPGHPDFIAEVERALSVLDVVVLVVSAVEGIQSQTRILMRTLKKLKIPTIIFINKVDRMGAREAELISEIQTQLFSQVIVLNRVNNIGGTDAYVTSIEDNKMEIDTVTKSQISRMEYCPVVFGSALTGVGISQLIQTLEIYFVRNQNNSASFLSALIFKIEYNQHDEQIAYIRIYSGELRIRDQVEIHRTERDPTETTHSAKITGMQLFKDGTAGDTKIAHTGDIVKVSGLHDCRIYDWLGITTKEISTYFAPPSLEAALVLKERADRPKLYKALQKMSVQDPLIQVNQNERGVVSVRLYGEVQREIIKTLLHNEYSLDVDFEKTQIIYVEKLRGIGEVSINRHDVDNQFPVTIAFKIQPGELNSGIIFKIGIGRGSFPIAFQKAIEETVYKTLEQGLYGWAVLDCIVEVTDAGYDSVQTTGGDFRKLLPLLLIDALQKAGTDIYEPVNYFEMDVHNRILSQVLQSLIKNEAKLDSTPSIQDAINHITGTIPVRRTFDFERGLPNLTQGEGSFTAEFNGYQRVCGTIPMRERMDNNPLNKEEYLRRTLRRE